MGSLDHTKSYQKIISPGSSLEILEKQHMYLDIRNEQNGWKPPITTQDALVIFYLLQVWDLSL